MTLGSCPAMGLLKHLMYGCLAAQKYASLRTEQARPHQVSALALQSSSDSSLKTAPVSRGWWHCLSVSDGIRCQHPCHSSSCMRLFSSHEIVTCPSKCFLSFLGKTQTCVEFYDFLFLKRIEINKAPPLQTSNFKCMSW